MADYEPRRGTKGAVIAYSTADGSTREIRAGDDGVVRPTDDDAQAVLDAMGVPVARKALAEAKADEAPAKAGKED